MSDSLLASPALKPRAGDLFNIDAALTEEERAIRDSVRAFVDEKVLPIIGQCYVDGRFPTELIAEMGQLGFFGANLPEEYGCAGLSNVAYGIINQELERGDSGIRSFSSVQGALVMYPIFTFGSDASTSCQVLFGFATRPPPGAGTCFASARNSCCSVSL